MDAVIKSYKASSDDDLMLCWREGVAYQADFAADRVQYGEAYQRKVDAYDGNEIAQRVNQGRCEMLARRLERGSTVFDLGAGSGAFVRAARAAGFDAVGCDVMPSAVDRLKAAGLFATLSPDFDAVTAWDVIEHMDEPAGWFDRVGRAAFVFISLPIFDSIGTIRRSKHYRPGEHLYYWTHRGFTLWMRSHGFVCVEYSSHEIDAGRDSIGAFAFHRRAV